MTVTNRTRTAISSLLLLTMLQPMALRAGVLPDSFPRYEIQFQEAYEDYTSRTKGPAHCHLPVIVDPASGFVIRTDALSITGLKTGDKVLALAGVPYQESLASGLRAFSPDDTLIVTVRRDGEAVDQEVRCASSEPIVSQRARILKLAGRSKWHLCYKYTKKLANVTPLNGRDLGIKFRCAQNNLKSSHYSRMMDKLKIARSLSEIRELQIETAMLTGHVQTPVEEIRESVEVIRRLGEEDLAQSLANQLAQLEFRSAHWVTDREIIRSSGLGSHFGSGDQEFAEALASYDNDEAAAAFGAFLALAKRGNGAAQFNVARMYEQGNGVDQDLPAAAIWYEKAAVNDITSAYPALKALAERESKANTGFGFHTMGNIYYYGLGVKKDVVQALGYYRKAADRDYPAALNKLAGFHDRGLVLEENRALAAQLYHRAAALGHTDALYNLAVAYAKGHGLDPAPEKAYAIFSSLAARGDQAADEARQVLSASLTEQQIESARALAMSLIEREHETLDLWKEN